MQILSRFSSPALLKESAWEYLLVSNMIGLESGLTIQFVAMVSTLRFMGVPVAFSSSPSFLAAILSQCLIVSMSFIGERYAKNKCGKTILLGIVNLLQVVGAMLIITGTSKELFYSEDCRPGSNSSTVVSNISLQTSFTSDTTLNNLNTNTSPTPYRNVIVIEDNSSTIASNKTHLHSQIMDLDILTLDSREPYYSLPSFDGNNSSFHRVEDNNDNIISSALPFPFNAALVIVGFALMESGFDVGNCFLKTYALICSPQENHAKILVKSTFISSIGKYY